MEELDLKKLNAISITVVCGSLEAMVVVLLGTRPRHTFAKGNSAMWSGKMRDNERAERNGGEVATHRVKSH